MTGGFSVEYLLGEPFLRTQQRATFYAPVGQAHLCREVLAETQDLRRVAQQLRDEYLALVHALISLGIQFRIVISRPLEDLDAGMVRMCFESLKLRGVGLQRFAMQAAFYPRDFATVFPNLVLVNPEWCRLLIHEQEGCTILSSPYGEGGRVLASSETVVVSERICDAGKENFRFARDEDIEPLKAHGLAVAFFPTPRTRDLTADALLNDYATNDHIDRVGCLLCGLGKRPHLIVDSAIETIRPVGTRGHRKHLDTAETFSLLRERCAPLGITLHASPALQIPYALNLVQFADGRVLMTSGDPALEQLVRSIVGQENVYTTAIPIRYFPAWNYAGIHCLVTEAPTALFRSTAS